MNEFQVYQDILKSLDEYFEPTHCSGCYKRHDATACPFRK